MRVEERRRELVESLSRLNSVANVSRKGRDDLDSSILEEAIAQQNRGEHSDPANASAALMVARDVTASFDALRAYLRQVANCLERVDPHLCNNPGLVERLVDWEETWELGLKYVRNAPVFYALGDVVAELQKAQEVTPCLKQMFDDCDVELFLCIPRIVLLRFLAEPGECGELLKDLLPHRFLDAPAPATPSSGQTCKESFRLPGAILPVAGDDGLPLEPFVVDEELEIFQDTYRRVCQSLLRLRPRPSDTTSGFVVWELLTRRVVVGTDGADTLYKLLLPSSREGEAMEVIVEELMRELEGWSLELQRHCPQDWNRCSALLIHCLLGGRQKHEQTSISQDPASPFRV